MPLNTVKFQHEFWEKQHHHHSNHRNNHTHKISDEAEISLHWECLERLYGRWILSTYRDKIKGYRQCNSYQSKQRQRQQAGRMQDMFEEVKQ
jgi:hypothetical protein